MTKSQPPQTPEEWKKQQGKLMNELVAKDKTPLYASKIGDN